MLKARIIGVLDPVVEVLCDKNAAVHAARTSDRDDKLALALLHLVRQKKIDESVEVLLELLRHVP